MKGGTERWLIPFPRHPQILAIPGRPKVLAVARALLRAGRTGDHHLECRQRRRRHHNLLPGRRRIRSHVLWTSSRLPRSPDHYPGDVRPDGRGVGQGALRPDSRTVRGADHLLPDDRPVSGQSWEHGFRICRCCGEPGDLRHQPLHLRAVQRRLCLVAGRQVEITSPWRRCFCLPASFTSPTSSPASWESRTGTPSALPC